MSRFYVCLCISAECQFFFTKALADVVHDICGGDLFPDLILWKGQPEILKKLWALVDYTMSYFSSPEKVLPTKAEAKRGTLLIASILAKSRLGRILV